MKTKTILRTGIVGISGYSGGEVLSLLLSHPQVRVTYISANNSKGTVGEIWPHLKKRSRLYCDTYNAQQAIALCDVLFLAIPHTVSMAVAPDLLKAGKKVIDLSGDYRLKDAKAYKTWYGTAHKDTARLGKTVYGLPELYREKIKKAQLVANPGCYPTSALLGLLPLLSLQSKTVQSVTIDAKSGVSGAGKKMAESLMATEVNENFKAYKVLNHQHTPEIEQHLSHVAKAKVKVTFVPHLLPVNRGILATIYVHLKESTNVTRLHNLYKKFYKTEPFVRVLEPGLQPELKNVVGTNYCDIALAIGKNKKMLVITTAIDNLLKGAAGQAVQNMNIMCQFKEEEGLL